MTAVLNESVPQRTPDAIVLNGISSSGTSTVARDLQGLLARPYLIFGVDTLVESMPRTLTTQGDGLVFQSDGRIDVGAAFTSLEDAWYIGLAAMAGAGVGLILDEVFLGGARSQRRLRAAMSGLQVLWVAVHCDVIVASGREAIRADRTPGMAALQASLVHEGVHYDMHVDTSRQSSAACAEQIRNHIYQQAAPC